MLLWEASQHGVGCEQCLLPTHGTAKRPCMYVLDSGLGAEATCLRQRFQPRQAPSCPPSRISPLRATDTMEFKEFVSIKRNRNNHATHRQPPSLRGCVGCVGCVLKIWRFGRGSRVGSRCRPERMSRLRNDARRLGGEATPFHHQYGQS